MATFCKDFIEGDDCSLSAMDSCRFQKNQEGPRIECDQPIHTGKEAKKQGVYGYYGDLYCPNCQEKFDFIFVEFEKPYPEFLSAWREIIMKEMDEDVVLCPRCGRRELEIV